MHKYSFLVFHEDYTHFLKNIQDKGVLHIIEKPSKDEDNEELYQKILFNKRLKEIVAILEFEIQNDEPSALKNNVAESEILEQVEALLDERNKIVLKKQESKKDIE